MRAREDREIAWPAAATGALDTPVEEWRAIPGYDGYEASTLGRVRSLDRYLTFPGRWGPTERFHRGRVLRIKIKSNGYCFVYTDGGRYLHVHRGVALAFHGEPPTEKHEGAHLNRKKADNRPSNIVWATHLENEEHARGHTAESAGFAVRSMIVWHKNFAAMGIGWCAQHELVLFGSRTPVKFDIKNGIGNVIESKRTGNPLHPTQKPVDLLVSILSVTDMATTIYDPFAGSGSTLIAAEQAGRAAFSIEMMATFCDVAVKRWQDFSGKQAVLDGDGRTFDQIAGERSASPAPLSAETVEGLNSGLNFTA